MDIIIEKEIPAPTAPISAALELMDVGDSFCFPITARYSLSVFITNTYHMVSNKRFTVSSKKQPSGKARVWRMPDYLPF